jgi:hypothetical protein
MGCPIVPVEYTPDDYDYDAELDDKKTETDQRRSNLNRPPAQASQGNPDVPLESETKLTTGGGGEGGDKKKEDGPHP